MKKTYRFLLPNGRTQTTDANRPDMIAMIDAVLADVQSRPNPMETDSFGGFVRYIVTNEYEFWSS